MLTTTALEKVKSLAQEVSEREGCRLYDIDFSSNPKNRVLRVYIDSASPEPVSIDQCANVSRGLSLLLDTDEFVSGGNYELEVSSPGVERVLREPWHFGLAVGQLVKVTTVEPISDLKGSVFSVTGRLTKVAEDGFFIEADGQEVRIRFQEVKKANVVFEFKKNEKKR